MRKPGIRKFISSDVDWERVKLIGSYKMFHASDPSLIYIGGTASMVGRPTGFYKRFDAHRRMLEQHRHPSRLLQEIVNKHGIDGLRFQILEVCTTKEEVRESEQYFMDMLKPKLNSTKSATSSLGYKHTEESVKKMSLMRRGKKRKPMSIEARKKMSDFAKTRDLSYLRSESVRIKKSEKRKGIRPEKALEALIKGVSQHTIDGVLIASFKSIAEASSMTKIDRSSISRVASGLRRLAGNFVWKFVE